MNKEEKEFFYSIGRGSLNLNGKFYYGLDYPITDFMNSLEQENKRQKEAIDKAINIAYEYGQIDGAHHKTWVIDQMIRELLGTEYDKFIKEYEEDGEYTWDIGIAP